MPGPVALPGLNDANPVRQNTAIRQISERLDDYAPLESPVLTGDPQAPTPDLADNDTSIATTAYVQGQNYTTKTYVDGANATQDTTIAGKAALVHTHAQSDVTGLVTALAGKEPTIAAGATSQYWRGDKTWQAFPTQRLIASYVDQFKTSTAVSTTYTTTGVPSSSGGTQISSRTVTTTSATQVIQIHAIVYAICGSTAFYLTSALFNGTSCVGASSTYSGFANQPFVCAVGAEVAPGAAGTYTISLRVGVTGGTATVSFGYGGVGSTSLHVQVIEP